MDAFLTADRSLPVRLLRTVFGYGFALGTEKTTIQRPTPSENQLLIKVSAVALNPVDNLCIDLVGGRSAILGSDFSGTVAAVGSKIKGWYVGQRAAGFVHGGMYKDQGAFAEYLTIDADLCWSPPTSLTDEQCASYGLPLATAMQAVNLELGLPLLPKQKPADSPAILIYAASGATGLFAVQLSKAAGCEVVAICSPHNFELVKKYGATATYDYHTPETLELVKQNHNIKYAYDALSQPQSTEFCAKVLGPSKGRLVTTLDTRSTAKKFGVDATWIMVFALFGKSFQWLAPVGPSFEASPEGRKKLVELYQKLPFHLEDIQPLPILSCPSSISNVGANLLKMKQEKPSGRKYTMLL